MLRDVVVVGASLAGLRAAETLRTEGYDGRLTLIGAEPHLPYDRPPLSKKLLAGDWEPDRIHLRKPDEYGDLDFELRLGAAAERLDTEARAVYLNDGSAVLYDGLVIATGASPRRLPNQRTELEGLFVLRNLDDSLALRAALDGQPKRVVVIGAGFIGAEVAATARVRGLEVTMVEALPMPLVRGLGPVMGSALADLHRARGVDVRLGVGVDAIEGDQRVERVRLSDGSVIEADVVLEAIGVAPATEWLSDCGIELRDGVVCDANLQAGTDVYAAGDLVRWPNGLFDEEMRVEHWTNAAEQGAVAAKNLLAGAAGGEQTPYAPVPFFWSDQYDARIQFVGRASGDDEVAVVHGSVAEERFVALYGRGDRFRGAFGFNTPKLVLPFRKLLANRASWDDALAFAKTQAS
jgi:NADPH-dependent 2,4-dienoyl-CoA reductase/sulfur reductase-like enzyme